MKNKTEKLSSWFLFEKGNNIATRRRIISLSPFVRGKVSAVRQTDGVRPALIIALPCNNRPSVGSQARRQVLHRGA